MKNKNLYKNLFTNLFVEIRSKFVVIRVSKKHRAFTFIELLIVIAIIGIMAGITMPNLKRTYSNFEIESFVKDISYLAKYLQSNSISYNKFHRMDITLNDDCAGFQGLTREKENEFIPIKGRFGEIYQSPAGITIFSIEPSGRTSIFFYPDGSLDKADIVFKNKYGKEVKLVLKGTGSSIQVK